MTNPPNTRTLIGINVAAFAVMVVTGVSPLAPRPVELLHWGANFGPLSLGPQPWRLLVSNYLHVGIIHLGLNMWCLWNLGLLAERIFEPWSYFLIYTACGLAGSLLSLWGHPMVVGVGASGAIFGLAGALIAALYLGRLPIPAPAIRGTLKSLVSFAGYNLLFGAAIPGIDNLAHIGGFLTGLALGAALAKSLLARPEARAARRHGVFLVAAMALTMGFILVKRVSGPQPRPLAGSENIR
jgi:rhomboid protease GluP